MSWFTKTFSDVKNGVGSAVHHATDVFRKGSPENNALRETAGDVGGVVGDVANWTRDTAFKTGDKTAQGVGRVLGAGGKAASGVLGAGGKAAATAIGSVGDAGSDIFSSLTVPLTVAAVVAVGGGAYLLSQK